MKEITVIYILYQMKATELLYTALDVMMKQSIRPDIVVCEQNDTSDSRLNDFCHNNNIKYVYLKEEKEDVGNIGYIKNMAIRHARSKYVYFCDTDIIVLDDRYLERTVRFMENSGESVLARIPMLRLIDGQDRFLKDYQNDNGLMEKLVINNPYNYCFVTYNEQKIDAVGKEYSYYQNNLPHVRCDIRNEWQLNYHSGGLFVLRSTLLGVGGYYQGYYKWGIEDIDLQWKLNETVGIRAFSECVLNTYLLHFEHDSRRNEIVYCRNRDKFHKRIKEGVEVAINKDVEEYDRLS